MDFGMKFTFTDENGKEQGAPFSQVLAHEMQHLSGYDQGNLDTSRDRLNHREHKESRAIGTENKVRKELHLPGQVGTGPTRTIHR